MNRNVLVCLGLGLLAPHLVMAESPSMMDLFFGGTLVDVLVSLTGLTVMALAPFYLILIILYYRKPSLQFSLAGKLSGVASVFMIVLMLFGIAAALLTMFSSLSQFPKITSVEIEAYSASVIIWGMIGASFVSALHLFNFTLAMILHHRKNKRAVVTLTEQTN